MMLSRPVWLEFGNEIPTRTRARIEYAFRVFAAIYGYRLDETHDALRCLYARRSDGTGDKRFFIPARYDEYLAGDDASRNKRKKYAGEDIFLFHGMDPETRRPDWLGEIFAWLTGNLERISKKRDEVGRIPFCETVFAKRGISPRRAHASRLMAWMEHVLRNGNGKEGFLKAASPIPGVEHAVLCSHDIDYYYTGRWPAAVRLTKNLGVGMRLYRSPSFLRSSLQMMGELAMGRRVGDYLPRLMAAGEEMEFRSTIFIVPRHGHRRDPNCRLEELQPHFARIAETGNGIELHGSYESVAKDGSLGNEAEALSKATRRKIRGNRQHWLRFDEHEKLYDAVEGAGLEFDSTLGFPDVPGFRNGASFPFPPYNFREERAYRFLEMPLVLMDGSLEAEARRTGENPQTIADEILRESREWGWGGIAALWHNPVEALQVPAEVNDVFWNCVRGQKEFSERWMSADEILAGSVRRYRDAGIWNGAENDAATASCAGAARAAGK